MSLWEDYGRSTTMSHPKPERLVLEPLKGATATHTEGCGRHGDRELTQFLSIASRSAAELEYQLLLAHDLAYLTSQVRRQLDALVGEVKRMLYRFIQTLAGSPECSANPPMGHSRTAGSSSTRWWAWRGLRI